MPEMMPKPKNIGEETTQLASQWDLEGPPITERAPKEGEIEVKVRGGARSTQPVEVKSEGFTPDMKDAPPFAERLTPLPSIPPSQFPKPDFSEMPEAVRRAQEEVQAGLELDDMMIGERPVVRPSPETLRAADEIEPSTKKGSEAA